VRQRSRATGEPCSVRSAHQRRQKAATLRSSRAKQQKSCAAASSSTLQLQNRAAGDSESHSSRAAQQRKQQHNVLLKSQTKWKKTISSKAVQAWTQEIGLWGGRMPGPCASMPPIDTEHAAQATKDLNDWVSRSELEQTPSSTAPPASLARTILKKLSREHSSQALENVKTAPIRSTSHYQTDYSRSAATRAR
jgi:hypothetical protein